MNWAERLSDILDVWSNVYFTLIRPVMPAALLVSITLIFITMLGYKKPVGRKPYGFIKLTKGDTMDLTKGEKDKLEDVISACIDGMYEDQEISKERHDEMIKWFAQQNGFDGLLPLQNVEPTEETTTEEVVEETPNEVVENEEPTVEYDDDTTYTEPKKKAA